MNDPKEIKDAVQVNTSQEVAKPIKQKTGRSIAVAALFFSVVALLGLGTVGAGAYVYLEQQIKALDNSTHKFDQDKEQNKELINKQSQEIAVLKQDYEAFKVDFSNDQKTVENVRNSFNTLVKNRFQWVLNETEYALGIVTLQLINTGSIEAALQSLNYIEERLSSFTYPELITLKKAIAQDIDNLKSANIVDISATLVTLEVLLSKVDGLPLTIDSVLASSNVESNETINKSLNPTWYNRIWDDFITTLKSGIQVRKLDSKDAMLVSPEQTFFIKENLKLILLDTRLALLQRKQSNYVQDLEMIRITVEQYFDVNSAEVSSFLASIRNLISLDIISPNIELIKNSITVVKSLQSNQEIAPIEQPTQYDATESTN